MLDKVAAQKEKISGIERYAPKTNMTIELGGTRKNLNVVSDLTELSRVWAFIKRETLQLKEAADELGVTFKDEFQGYPTHEWFEDIKARVNKVRISQERDSLKKMEAALENLMSNDFKVERELAKLEELLG
jgi:hypothetical protein